MKDLLVFKKQLYLSISLALTLGCTSVFAKQENTGYQLGVTLGGMAWNGDNGDTGSEDFNSEATRIGFQFSARKGNWYAGIGLHSAEYVFEDGEPDREPVVGSSSEVNPTIALGQLDITAGYYVLPKMSVFLGVKNYGLTWIDQDYKTNYSGLGGGVSGFYPLNQNWLLFGSLGVTSLNVKSDNKDIGTGEATSIELGTLYQWIPNTAFTFGVQSQTLALSYDNGDEQNHSVGGLLVGVQYAFGND